MGSFLLKTPTCSIFYALYSWHCIDCNPTVSWFCLPIHSASCCDCSYNISNQAPSEWVASVNGRRFKINNSHPHRSLHYFGQTNLLRFWLIRIFFFFFFWGQNSQVYFFGLYDYFPHSHNGRDPAGPCRAQVRRPSAICCSNFEEFDEKNPKTSWSNQKLIMRFPLTAGQDLI